MRAGCEDTSVMEMVRTENGYRNPLGVSASEMRLGLCTCGASARVLFTLIDFMGRRRTLTGRILGGMGLLV